MFSFFPNLGAASLETSYLEVEQKLREIPNQTWREYEISTRRHLKGQPTSLHMGFYEQNLPGVKERTWKLYKETDKSLLLSLKPILRQFSEIFISSLGTSAELPCPLEYGLFGTVFTTIAINRADCNWHIDPKDKLTALIYLGQFTGGRLAVAEPLNLKVPLRRFDAVLLQSQRVFHKAENFTGERFSISLFSKQTTKHTKKGTLTVCKEGLWAIKM